MPISKYDGLYGGKPGSAQKAHDAMVKQYGPQEGERVFYATANRNKQGKKPPMKRKHHRHRRKKKRGGIRAIAGY